MDITSVFIIAALILSIILHEVAHGFMANRLGDPTARLAGRLTLNPIPHIDLFGSIILPGLLFITHAGMLFGWAKPVPYNPYNLRNRKWGEALVAAAGPGTNLLIALLFGIGLRVMAPADVTPFVVIVGYIVYVNIQLAFFNLIPIPPLDGSKVLAAFLPLRAQMRFEELAHRMQQFGLIAAFLFIFIFTNFLWVPFSALINLVFSLITGVSFF
jgi:Zn-dependent protease